MSKFRTAFSTKTLLDHKGQPFACSCGGGRFMPKDNANWEFRCVKCHRAYLRIPVEGDNVFGIIPKPPELEQKERMEVREAGGGLMVHEDDIEGALEYLTNLPDIRERDMFWVRTFSDQYAAKGTLSPRQREVLANIYVRYGGTVDGA